MNTIELIAAQAASGAFGETLPDNFYDLTEEQQSEWLEENRWGIHDGLSSDKYYALIDNHAEAIKLDVIKPVLALVKEALVNAAIEGELPRDYNDLDLPALIKMSQ